MNLERIFEKVLKETMIGDMNGTIEKWRKQETTLDTAIRELKDQGFSYSDAKNSLLNTKSALVLTLIKLRNRGFTEETIIEEIISHSSEKDQLCFLEIIEQL